MAGNQRVTEVHEGMGVVHAQKRGGILICEDGDAPVDQTESGTQLLGLTRVGNSFVFARNNVLLRKA